MRKVLCFDTETNGFKDPRIVQIAALLFEEETGREIAQFSALRS